MLNNYLLHPQVSYNEIWYYMFGSGKDVYDLGDYTTCRSQSYEMYALAHVVDKTQGNTNEPFYFGTCIPNECKTDLEPYTQFIEKTAKLQGF
jgi:hypothetical protein